MNIFSRFLACFKPRATTAIEAEICREMRARQLRLEVPLYHYASLIGATEKARATALLHFRDQLDAGVSVGTALYRAKVFMEDLTPPVTSPLVRALRNEPGRMALRFEHSSQYDNG